MEYLVFCLAAAGFILLIMGKWIYDDHKAKKDFLKKLKNNYGIIEEKNYGADRFQAVTKFFTHHREEEQIDDITWNDLGGDAVYRHMNTALSSTGEEYLYYLLRTPGKKAIDPKHFEELVSYFEEHEKERIDMQILFKELGYTGRFSMYDYLDHLDILGDRNNIKNYITLALYAVFIGIFFVNETIGILGFIGVMAYAMLSYFVEKADIEPYITSFAYVMHLLDVTEKMTESPVPVIKEECQKMKECRRKLQSFQRGSFWLMSNARMSGSGNPLDILFDYLRMAFHLDLMKFNNMLKQIKEHTKEVDMLFALSGYIECAIVVGNYRKSLNGEYCIPEFEENASLEIEELAHPLLKEPVKNSIRAQKGVLLTGSNASGKSTFLKSVALAALMAQTIHTVCAKAYRGDHYRILSSMALKDDLLGGESYYIVEIRSMKRIIDETKKNKKVLCFVDEVLRGTNTVERIAASCEILKSLSKRGTICFAATHDIELTDLLNEEYDNYHFEEEIEQGDVVFNYILKPGKATTRNAIKLLSVMGYDGEIVKTAAKRADDFVNTGIWHR